MPTPEPSEFTPLYGFISRAYAVRRAGGLVYPKATSIRIVYDEMVARMPRACRYLITRCLRRWAPSCVKLFVKSAMGDEFKFDYPMSVNGTCRLCNSNH